MKIMLFITLLCVSLIAYASQKPDEDLSMSVYVANIQALSKPATRAPQLLPKERMSS